MILFIDNYDSFTYNLVQILQVLEHEVKVFRNDQITLDRIEKEGPSGMVISPGPCTPDQAGISVEA
ncbi:MAG: anthranilate/aminodeoxychorismate synthase component II, partial [Desulfobacteraceae bacterium]|nr:anthranilate/aminodeoxychorismate synthase component II [Desulfobacteraceae bacterium]